MTDLRTKSQAVSDDIAALLRARNPLLWIVTREEARVERYLFQAAAATKYVPLTWDCAAGVSNADGARQTFGGRDPGDTFAAIEQQVDPDQAKDVSPTRRAWIMRDLPPWLSGPAGMATTRQLRNLIRALPSVPPPNAQAIIVLSTSADVPADLAGHATVIEWPLPDRAEIASILDEAIECLPVDLRYDAAPNGTRDAAIDAAVGLSGEEAQACYARSLVQLKRIDPATVAKEKRRVVARERVLEWFDPLPGGLEAVGGLESLKEWLRARKLAYSPAARAYGLPAPKGALIAGIPGTGKSMIAKAIATAWGVPLLRLDMGSLKSKFVGESEGNIRKAFAVIEAIGRCVVWIDEIEKAMQGATSGSSDGGTSTDQLGAILNWMQERRGEAFVVATANDAESLPPELIRKGRFDEVWWVDLPNQGERMAILQASLRSFGRAVSADDLLEVARTTEAFTGAEIAALVPEAMFAAFADSAREVTTNDLLAVARVVVPLSKTAPDKIDKLRNWAKGKARPATAPIETKPAERRVRALDIA